MKIKEMKRPQLQRRPELHIYKNGGLRNIPRSSFCLPYKIGTNGIIAHLETAALFRG